MLFVWDGSSSYLDQAEQWLESTNANRVIAIHAIPHESIYSYGTVLNDGSELEIATRKLSRRFFATVRKTGRLRKAKFELLVGDRISEICRYAEVIKADAILLPMFQQSSFSKWIHGDLNKRLAKLAHCPVIFLEPELSQRRRPGNTKA